MKIHIQVSIEFDVFNILKTSNLYNNLFFFFGCLPVIFFRFFGLKNDRSPGGFMGELDLGLRYMNPVFRPGAIA